MDAMGYSIIFFWGVIPILIFINSFIIGKHKEWGLLRWLMSVSSGIMYMLASYATFSLANNIMFNVEAFDGYLEVEHKISELYHGTPSFPNVLVDSPFGKLDNLIDLVYGYIPSSYKDAKAEEKMFDVLHDEFLSTDEKIKAIEKLHDECKVKKK